MEDKKMQCREVQQQLNGLCDGERLSPVGRYLETTRHVLACRECREAWRRLRQMRRLARRLPCASVPASLREPILPRLLDVLPGAEPAGRGRRQIITRAAQAAVVVGLVGLGLVVVPWKKDRPVGEAVEAAVRGANTWHLKGWKLRDGQRVPWEIWGRRSPFFYREQLGDELNFDDSTQRVRLVPTGEPEQRLALRLASGPAPSDQWSQWLTMGAGWRGSMVLRETRDQILVRGGLDCGMQGPYSIARDYFWIDKRTWLPLEWEYRQSWSNSKAPEQVIDALQAEYDVPLPAAVTTLRLPAGVRVADTLSAPPDADLPTENVQRAHGLTVQAQALAIDPDSNILVRVRSWLGSFKLGAEGTGTSNDVETSHRYRTVNLLQPPPPTVETGYRTEDGQVYAPFDLPRLHLWLANGDVLMMLAPLEPRPAGAALPRLLTLDLVVVPQVATRAGRMWSSSVLFDQEFTWTLPLPAQAAPIRIDDFLPPGHRDRGHYLPGADDSTVAGNIDRARAGAYGIARRYERAIYWLRQGLAAVPPFTNDAQLRRLDLANVYEQAGDRARAAAAYREVMRISREHPETWNYYAYQAKGELEYLAHNHRRRG
jgi:hypothetical protein